MHNCIFQNNIMIGSTMFLPGSTQNHNVFGAAKAGFVDQAANNYQLAAGSSAINAGVVIAPYTNGFIGSAPDIGALEYGGAALSIGVPTVARSPYAMTPAQNYDAQQGTTITPPGVGSINDGDFLEYSAEALGNGVSTFTANLGVPAANAGGTIELHIDTPTGPLLGILTTTSTGSFTTYASQSINVASPSGIRDLYLVFHGGYGIGNLKWFQFS
jgi:hypothetical protein